MRSGQVPRPGGGRERWSCLRAACVAVAGEYPNDGDVICYWSRALLELGRLETDPETAGGLLRETGESLGKTRDCAPDNNLWRYKANPGAVPAEQSPLPDWGREREKLERRAESLWDEAEALKRGASALHRTAWASRLAKSGSRIILILSRKLV